MSNISIYHCRDLYYREFAFKTVKGIDIPNKDGELPDVRRLNFKPITDNTMLEKILRRYANRPGNYISVYSFAKLKEKGTIDADSAKINRIYLDFDLDSNVQQAISEALLTVKSLIRRGIFSHCYFSGNRGIALYIEFTTTEIQPKNKKEVIGLFFDLVKDAVAKDYENFFGLWIKPTQPGFEAIHETLDHSIRGDIARVSRIPNTKHKSGLYCIPLSFGDMWKGINHIRQIASAPVNVNLDRIISYCILRNETMPTIIKNIEKEVMSDRSHELKLKELKQKQYEIIKIKNPNRKKPISDEDIQRAKNTPLSRVISNENRMKCPIHGGDNPTSFYIDHNKNYWYCHSCGKGGDAITYLMEKEHTDFKTAVKQLAEA